MELIELQSLLGNYEELQKRILADNPKQDLAPLQKQYNPKDHDVMDNAKRPDKLVDTEQGASTVKVTRIPVAMQKKVVRFAATFLMGNPIKLVCNPADDAQSKFLALVQKVWDDNKLDYKGKGIAKLVMSELEAAELWYTEPVDPLYWVGTALEGVEFRLRMKVLANKYGDKLYPIFNAAGDMIGFGRGYSTKEADKIVERFDLYTDTQIYFGIKAENGWAVTTQANVIGKISIIYYSQEEPEWNDAQWQIDRLETVKSNHGDTNDYFGSPLIKTEGEIKGFSKKGEQGKVLQLENGAKADYLTWDSSPESVKLEHDQLRASIHELTDTPDISFEQVKGLGNFSGVALKMLFLNAHMKASDHEETFGECVQRRINYIKAAIGKLSLSLEPLVGMTIKPGFEYYLPKNDTEKVDTLIAAVGGGIMSKKTAVAQNPLVQDPDKELLNIEEEAAAGLDDSFNV